MSDTNRSNLIGMLVVFVIAMLLGVVFVGLNISNENNPAYQDNVVGIINEGVNK